MMMQFNKTALASALALALTACGGGGGSDGGGGNDDTVTISGTASKGIISRADILINGEPTGVITGTDGSYTVPIPTGATPPFEITIQGNADAEQLCDNATGCGDGVAFGAPFSYPSGLNLRAIVPDVTSDTTVNVTVFSEAAAAIFEDLSNSGSSQTPAQLAATANSQVATIVESLTGTTGLDITALPVTNITSIDTVQSAASDPSQSLGVFISQLSGSLLSTLNPSRSINDAITSFSSAISNAVNTNTTVTSLEVLADPDTPDLSFTTQSLAQVIDEAISVAVEADPDFVAPDVDALIEDISTQAGGSTPEPATGATGATGGTGGNSAGIGSE